MNGLKRKDSINTSESIVDIKSSLKMYYATSFPFDTIFNWLSCGDFSRREMCYTLLENENEIYIRYKSWPSAEEFASEIRSLCPIKLDIGATYPCAPSERETIGALFKPQTKELVFDIDITDYDNVRSCCKSTNMCKTCWPLITTAIKVVDRLLRQCFGFFQLLWIYSGRRGVHCWVSDARARLLSQKGRAAVLDYLISVGKGGPVFESIRAFLGDRPYPRFDNGVTLGFGHLLKCPFVVHPKTGRICVPVDPSRCDDFDPFLSPMIHSDPSELIPYLEFFGSYVKETI